MRIDVLSAVRQPISLIGVAVTTAMAVVFLVLFALELSGHITNRTLGCSCSSRCQLCSCSALLLIPLGVWRQRRRARAGRALETR